MKKTVFDKAKGKVSFLLTLIVIASSGIFSSCASTQSEQIALSLNGVDISNDVFTYFIDVAMNELGTNADENSVLTKAVSLTETYFKTNSLAHKQKVELSTANKAKVSEKVNAYWGIYGEYYSSIGVSKQTLTKVFTADAYRNRLLEFYYGEGGENEVGVANMYAYFKMNYIVFQAINGYFTFLNDAGFEQRLSDNEIEEIVLKFQNMASLINAEEKNMEEAADFLTSSNYTTSVVTMVLGKNDTTYPPGFFEKVQKTRARSATVIGTSENIFLVLRGDAGVNSEYYKEKQEEILIALVGDKIDVKIKESLATESSLKDANTKTLYLLVKQEKAA